MYGFNPLDPMTQGMELGQRFDQTADLERQRREMLAEREAMALLGQQPNFTGYENVPGATRPNWLRQMFAQGSPETALKYEALASSPYALQRDIYKSGEIERAKRQADQEVWNNLLTKYFPTQESVGPIGIPQDGSIPSGPMSAGPMPSGNQNAMGAALMPQPNMAGLSDQERSFELGPHGPKLSIKNPSPFEKYTKLQDLAVKQGGLDVQRGGLEVQRGGLEVQRGGLTREQNKDRDAAIQQAHENVRMANDKILEVRRNMETGDLDMETGKQAIAELMAQKQQFTAQREALVRGQATPQAPAAPAEAGPTAEAPSMLPNPSAPVTLAPKQRRELQQRELDPGVKLDARKQAEEQVARIRDQIQATETKANTGDLSSGQANAQLNALHKEMKAAMAQRDALVSGQAPATGSPATPAAPAMLPSPRSMKPVAPASTPATEAASAPQTALPGKMQMQADQKQLEEKRTAAGKEIVNAREHAQKLQQYKKQVQEIFDLVTKHDIGAPVVGNLPGGIGTTALMVDKDYARLKNLNDALTNMFSQPGQSQLMNTIIERQMQSASVPGMTTEPQQNKMNAAVLRSNVDHLLQLPTFLEKWQKTHGGTLDGATDAWIDYTEHNPTYIYEKDKRGKVTVKENSAVIPRDTWLKLRSEGRIKTLKNGTVLIQEPD